MIKHHGHLSCFVTKMLYIFAAAGHHQYAKGAWLYCQLMKELETLPAYKDTLEHFLAYGNHVVCYSSHEWSGTWCDICIEQTLMKAAKSEGGLSRGRMRNSFSGQKCWVLTLSHFSDINQRLEEDVSKYMHHSIETFSGHRWSELQRQLNLPYNGLRRTCHLTTIETRSCSCLSQQDSQAQEVTQSMLREQLKWGWKCRSSWMDSQWHRAWMSNPR